MCGISGIISKYDKNIIDLLFSSIKQLENRGYDSMGLCLYLNNEFQIFKSCNKMLDNSLKMTNLLLVLRIQDGLHMVVLILTILTLLFLIIKKLF